MPKMPTLSGTEVVAILGEFGFRPVSQALCLIDLQAGVFARQMYSVWSVMPNSRQAPSPRVLSSELLHSRDHLLFGELRSCGRLLLLFPRSFPSCD